MPYDVTAALYLARTCTSAHPQSRHSRIESASFGALVRRRATSKWSTRAPLL